MTLAEVVADFAAAIKVIDSRRPQASNARSGALYQPGIGPHPETRAVALVAAELAALNASRYGDRVFENVPYPSSPRQKCDLCIGRQDSWDWCIEVKMLRLMGDNGKPNDNMLAHILSPYPAHRSALTDCSKISASGFKARKAVVIYGFDYADFSMDPVINAFETLAAKQVRMTNRLESAYEDLCHPVHRAGRVFGWEVSSVSEPTN